MTKGKSLPFKDIEITSLMIAYVKGELTASCEQHMKRLIADCVECKKLYNEISRFFDDSAASLYEITHKDEVANARMAIDLLAEQDKPNQMDWKQSKTNRNCKDEIERILDNVQPLEL